MKKAGYALIIFTVMCCIFGCGFLVGRNANRSSITVIAPTSVSSNSVKASGKVNINKASVDELTLLPGIGPKIAARIVDYRSTIGRFRTVSDLCNINGISEEMLITLLDYITV